jgi:hypothetical protein
MHSNGATDNLLGQIVRAHIKRNRSFVLALCLRASVASHSLTALQARLYAGGQRTKITYSLDFVVGQFNAEMIFQPAKELQGLQAIDAQFAEEIVIRRKRTGGHVEVFCGEIEDLLSRLLDGAHVHVNLSFQSQEGKQMGRRQRSRRQRGGR